ncbi:squalene synthase HpnC [Sphingomonas paeninsulae]|uniref:Squalene synthase HpnC n=1 Tax=Sphingomonas paeninsulae TaxID=2319844 RepID=A0A494TQ91_SPHPE|nr:squalene synthase HpnC [Sphingomonas paeninsulae]AYJ88001.1 squalene synthase HpnC [Sphingomonas paeninsulae]
MTADAATSASGKGHKDENFPVASVLLKAEHRAPVMAFYRFARAADDVADNATVDAGERLAVLTEMRATLAGTSDVSSEARALRETLSERGLSPRHGLDLLTAFERDCRVNRCRDWDDLIDYCRYSAMPVGRYVLDVHGESRDCWPASDSLCAALQVINHLQDCGKDYRAIDRVYVPLDTLAKHGAVVRDLGASVATPQLRSVIVALAERTDDLLARSAGFASQIKDRRLAVEVAIIHRLAVSLNNRLKTRDPLSERVHHSKPEALGLAVMAALSQMVGR